MRHFLSLLAAVLLLAGLVSCKGTPERVTPPAETPSEPIVSERTTVSPTARHDYVKDPVNPDVVGAVVLVVNEEIVTKEEILDDLKTDFAKIDSDKSLTELGRREKRAKLIHDQLHYRAEQMLALQEARRRLDEEQKARIERDVDYYVKSLIRKVGSAAQLEQELASQGLTIKTKTTAEIERRMIAELLIEQIGQHTLVRPQEMRAYYDAHAADYHRKRAVHIRQIFLAFTGFADKEPVRQRARDVLARLKKGEDFAALAKRYSQGPHAAEGGLWPEFIERGTGELRPEVEKVVFRLPVKGVSPLIETEIGCHIIKVDDLRPERQIPFTEVQEDISGVLQNQKHEARKREFIDKLWKNSYVQVRWK